MKDENLNPRAGARVTSHQNSTHMRTFISGILALLLTIPSFGQPGRSGDWLGKTRQEIHESRDKDGFEVETKKEDVECYDFELVKTRYCYWFVSDVVRMWSESDIQTRKKDALKEAYKMKKKWGQPLAIIADRTEVENLDQALRLADPMVRVIYPSVKRVGAKWWFDVEPDEEKSEAFGQYTFTKIYIDVSYASEVSSRNYWR